MASHNSYVTYKRETKQLLHWIIASSNTIITLASTNFTDEDEPKTLNNTGQTTVSGLVSMAKLIAKYATRKPPTSVYSLLLSVVQARTKAWAAYQSTSAASADPQLVEYNAAHKHFIDSLNQIFVILGGEEWRSSQNGGQSDSIPDDEIPLLNKFEVLGIDLPKEEAGDEEDSDASGHDEASPELQRVPRRKQPRPGRGKKGKKGKKSKKKQPAAPVKGPDLADVPLESYKIIEDTDGIITDYLLATYALAKEWIDLRMFLQDTWKEVAYGNLNSAVAGALSTLAVAMIQRAELTIFVDFPGHDSYETIMNTITRGDPEKMQGNFGLNLIQLSPDGQRGTTVRETYLDVKEQLLVNTYQALLDFVVDYQKTRSGAPTRAMMKEIRDWNPAFNLQRATQAERLAWRRSFTINWLYDLVNLFSSIVTQRNTMKGQHWVYENVDWSPDGPWNQHRRLFGLNEFAGVITSLAMQKPTTDVRHRIRPHHVFQLQCIVDSVAVSRGWYCHFMRGHLLESPPRGFRPRRDVDLFLDRETKNFGKGYLQGVSVLNQLLERDAQLHGEPHRHTQKIEVLDLMQDDFINWLGETKYMHGLTNIPPSRFTNSNANGLWEHSPYLCGVGLMEGLELAYNSSIAVWDMIHEPILCMHLHNMLVQKGYIKKPVGLYASLEQFFATDFFAQGKPPTSDFFEALQARLSEVSSNKARRELMRAKEVIRQSHNIHEILGSGTRSFFKTKSHLQLYREANWNPVLIPDSEIHPDSYLGLVRILQTKHYIDPVTGQTRLDETDLVRRAKEKGMGDEELLNMSSVFAQTIKPMQVSPDVLQCLPDGFVHRPPADLQSRIPGNAHPTSSPSAPSLSNRDLLQILQGDIFGDVCGRNPLSSLNYNWAACTIFSVFMRVEDQLRELRNPVWVRAYETDRQWASMKRVGLTYLAMIEEDDECLRVMAEVFENPRSGFMDHTYWELEVMDSAQNKPTKKAREGDDIPDLDCTVM
ncbi:hypothetical protein EDB81DRAFT_808203 [Dactylonectria macrodidyma]|uniref:DUF6604 domain-containing protein n=1 Tax=Dactylonectria macrodidyma TaxID=307937 RepID=A0A9P9ISY0_9HYPO|nr:hypothetical protein EDB81DRAFT_808203 [Dactylonectria macrodidyma]